MSTKGFIDIHCHSVMTHYRNKNQNIPVCKEISRDVWPLLDAITGTEALRSYNTQSDFGKLAKNNAEAIIISLYAVERKWLLPKLADSGFKIKLISNITGFSKANILEMAQESPIDYYKDLKNEYDYLLSQLHSQCNGKKFMIVKDFLEMEQNLLAGDTVSIILSVEGASSLGKGLLDSDLELNPDDANIDIYNKFYKENIFRMKSWGPNNDGTHAPLFITFAHHFWNMLGGHCESLPGLLNQRTGKETGLTEAGWEALNDLISTKDINGQTNKLRKILIDIKHMSPISRQEYYKYLVDNSLNIPIIVSHASIGDAPNLKCFIKGTQENRGFVAPKNYFNTSSLSLNGEDVDHIVRSDGLIGIILHEKRIAHKDVMKRKAYGVNRNKKIIEGCDSQIEKLQFQITQAKFISEKTSLVRKIENRMEKKKNAINEIKEAYIKMIMANIYMVVETVWLRNNLNKGKGWEHVCIGSDFDGTINKMDYLGTANEFPELRERMLGFLKHPTELKGFNKTWTGKRLKELQFGKDPEELTEMFFTKNVKSFLKKYFNEGYLKR